MSDENKPHNSKNEQTDTNNEEKIQLVHYTTAEAAFKILENEEIWMRKASVMNDLQEIDHARRYFLGQETIEKILNHSNAIEEEYLKKIEEIKSSHEDDNKKTVLLEELEQHYSNTQSSMAEYFLNTAFSIKMKQSKEFEEFKEKVYITSFSQVKEFETKKKCYRGRLSMWRSYGKNMGVAIIFNEKFVKDLMDLQKKYIGHSECTRFPKEIFHRKVIYQELNDDKLYKDMTNKFARKPIPSTEYLFIKHPGFEEETEWRVALEEYALNEQDVLLQQDETLEIETDKIKIEKGNEVISGIPQTIYKLKFNADRHIDYIIIGPTPFPKAIRDSFLRLFTDTREVKPLKEKFGRAQREILEPYYFESDKDKIDLEKPLLTSEDLAKWKEWESLMQQYKDKKIPEILDKIKLSDIPLR